VRDHFVPVFQKGKVDLVVAGHAHAYQRMDLEGVRYVVVGGAGGRLDRYQTGHWGMDKDYVGHHWALMDIVPSARGPQLSWTAKDFDGQLIDAWTLTSRSKRTAR
jgi:hypothetical protein